MTGLPMISSFLWIVLLSNLITVAVSEACRGIGDADTQLQTAIEYTKTEEFEELFESLRDTIEWQVYTQFVRDTLKVDIEDIIRTADPYDTIASLKKRVESTIPLHIKIKYLLDKNSLKLEEITAMFKTVAKLPEIKAIKGELCAYNVNFDEIEASLV